MLILIPVVFRDLKINKISSPVLLLDFNNLHLRASNFLTLEI